MNNQNDIGGVMFMSGRKIRIDRGGDGHFGAKRSKINSQGETEVYSHKGVDYECIPGDPEYMPFTGRIIREARPYAKGPYTGVLIESKRMTVKIFYVEPYPEVIGKVLKIGTPIGKCQDISIKYKKQGVTPHVHIQVESVDPDIFFSGPIKKT